MRKAQRVKSEKDFQLVFERGTSYANRQFVVYVYEKKDQPYFRIGLSVSKRLGNAVKRNQIKRYIRHSFLEMKKELKQDVDYVIIARQQAKDLDFHQTKKSLQHVLRIARCLPRTKKRTRTKVDGGVHS